LRAEESVKRRERSSHRAVPVRIGIHTSIADRLERAAERAHELGYDAFPIFSDRSQSGERPAAARL
jgi:endonuclease IV